MKRSLMAREKKAVSRFQPKHDFWQIGDEVSGRGIAFVFSSKEDALLMAAAEDVLAALHKAVETIHALHGDVCWDIYARCSPEMKQIFAAIAKAEGLS